MQGKKKTYTAPTVTEHGSITESTKGWGGMYWELYSPQSWPHIEDPKEDPKEN